MAPDSRGLQGRDDVIRLRGVYSSSFFTSPISFNTLLVLGKGLDFVTFHPELEKLWVAFARLNAQLRVWAANPSQHLERVMNAKKGRIFATSVLSSLSTGEYRSLPEIRRDIEDATRRNGNRVDRRHAYRIATRCFRCLCVHTPRIDGVDNGEYWDRGDTSAVRPHDTSTAYTPRSRR